MGRCHIITEPNAPTSAPLGIGDHFIDTSTGDHYLSKGTASVADWVVLVQGSITHASTTGQGPNDHHNEDHQARHNAGGADALKLDDLAAPDDNTDLNASTSAHGLMQKYPGGTTNYLRADGTFAAPPNNSKWTDAGAHTYLTSATDNVSVGTTAAPDAGFRMKIQNVGNTNGLIIQAGEDDTDNAFRIHDQDNTLVLHNVNGNGDAFYEGDLNLVNGVYLLGGVPLSVYGLGGITDSIASATNELTLSSTTYALITNMTITPPAGTYRATFSCSGRAQTAAQQIQYALFSAGVIIPHSERDYGWDLEDPANEDQRVPFHTQSTNIVVNGAQAIDVRYNTNISSVRFFERSLILTRIA